MPLHERGGENRVLRRIVGESPRGADIVLADAEIVRRRVEVVAQVRIAVGGTGREREVDDDAVAGVKVGTRPAAEDVHARNDLRVVDADVFGAHEGEVDADRVRIDELDGRIRTGTARPEEDAGGKPRELDPQLARHARNERIGTVRTADGRANDGIIRIVSRYSYAGYAKITGNRHRSSAAVRQSGRGIDRTVRVKILKDGSRHNRSRSIFQCNKLQSTAA